MDGLRKKKRPNLPRMDRMQIIHECLSGRKTAAMLAREYGLDKSAVCKMISRYKQKNDIIFTETICPPIMPRKRTNPSNDAAQQAEIEELKRQLQLAQLKIEGYQIMGDILEEEYGIDLLKKAGAEQCRVSKKDMQK